MADSRTQLILASGSPRRRRLLEALGLAFRVVVPRVDESAVDRPSAVDLAVALARMKCEAVFDSLDALEQKLPVVAADTLVEIDGEVLGKPVDRADAARMLRKLSGRTHRVVTGVAIRSGSDPTWSGAEETDVTFHPLDEAAIARWVESGEADDKAGAYGVQEVGKAFIASIDGDPSNVIGLPLRCLARGFDAVGLGGLPRGKILLQAVFDAFPEMRELSRGTLE